MKDKQREVIMTSVTIDNGEDKLTVSIPGKIKLEDFYNKLKNITFDCEQLYRDYKE